MYHDDGERNVNIYSPGNLPKRGSLARMVHGINRKAGSSTQVGTKSLSMSESQLVMQTMKRRRDELKRQENFRTKAMREIERLRNMKIYTSVLLRIQFSDSWMIEANFSPAETISDVTHYLVRCLLVKDIKPEDIYFFVTPPKQILERNATLADAGLQPAALIYVGFSDGKGGLRNGASCILPSAIELAAKTASDGPSSGGKDGGQPFFPSATAVSIEGKRGSSKLVDQGGKSSGSKKKPMKKPKWLKT